MKKITFLILALFIGLTSLNAQNFPGTGGGIPDDTCDATNEFQLDLSAAGLGILGTTNQIDQVDVDITHTWVSDITITLVAPDATEVVLIDGVGGSGDDFTGTTFIDGGTDPITPPFTGNIDPENPLTSGFNGIDADGVWILRVCDGGSGDVGTLNSWSLTFGPAPSCSTVSGVTIDSFTDSEVNISWTASASGETNWEVVVQSGTGEPAAADGTGVDVATTSYTDNTLSSNTAYEVWVRAECTAGTDFGPWVGPITFSTLCNAFPIPFDESFDSTSTSESCWTVLNENADFDEWDTDYTLDTISGDESAALNTDFNAGNNDDWLISPAITLTGNERLRFRYSLQSPAEPNDFEVLLSTTGTATASFTNTLIPLMSYNDVDVDNGESTELIVDLSAYSGDVNIAWHVPSGGLDGWRLYIDDVVVETLPSTATVDYCNLQFPSNGNITQGDAYQVFARIFQAGVTDSPGQGADIEAWIGYSATDATTLVDFESTDWTWVPATYNTDTDGGNNDEYQADLGPEVNLGRTYYVSRFRYDNGVYAYGGINPGSSGGDFWGTNGTVSGELFTTPITEASLAINGCNDQDSHNEPFDASTKPVVWAELAYDGNCQRIIVDTENSDFDTEIGVYDSNGDLVANNDDDIGGITPQSRVTLDGLPAGTYYIAAGSFNVDYGGTNFDVSSSETTTGTIHINARTPNVPDFVNIQFPGTATITAGNTQDVFAQIFESGVTPGAGQGANITAEIGVSAVDATTTADFETVDWTWTAANYNAAVTGNNDEYSLAIGASLAPGTYYYVSRFSIDGGPFVYGGSDISDGIDGNFWDGVSFVSGVLTVNPAPEPTNHVTTFAAAADSDTEITLTWNDNDGAQPADGFLIVGKTAAASFYMPADGTDDADDTDWSDDEAEVKVVSGVQTYTFTGLNASTLYEFEIYPYTNSGATIDYKTDATVPNTSATTDADPCLIAITTFPFNEGFESGVPPQCWVSFRGTNGEGTGFDWTTSTTANTGSSSAFVRYEAVANSAQDWLVTPLLDFSALTNPELSFFARESFGSNFGSVHSIQVSTTDTNIASFSSVQGYTEDDFSSTTFEQFIVDLSSFAGESSVYIAFVMENDDGDSWFIDDVSIYNNPPVTYTYNGSWSPSDPNGASDANDDIVVSSGNAPISSDTSCNSVTVNPGAAITVNSGITLTIVTNMTLESVSNNYSNLMLEGSVAGTILYQRYVNANGSGNDLISPPLVGQTWASFLGDGTNAADLLDDGMVGPTTYVFGPFDKASDDWLNYTDATVATLMNGTGYRAGTDSGATLTFTGTVETGQVPVNIEDTGAMFPDWNLIGNPYPSYLNMLDFLNFDIDGAGTGTERNIDILEDLSGIYGYDGSASNGWDVITLANAGVRDMAPGQGFFVAANDAFVASHDITFDPTMRRAGTGDDFILGRNSSQLTYLKLYASTAANDYTTQFYFNDNATVGLDHGYDAKLWGDIAPSFALYSNLVEDNTGVPIALQALNPSDLVDVIIPLGVNANLGEQLTFTISETTLPSTIDVYLDDTLTNTSTLLNNSDYVITPSSDITGTGRFYLRFAEQALSNAEEDFDNIKIYTTPAPRTINIHGMLIGETTAKVYDLQGRLVHSSVMNNNALVNEIDATDFSDGIYVVSLSNGVQEKTQKVIIR